MIWEELGSHAVGTMMILVTTVMKLMGLRPGCWAEGFKLVVARTSVRSTVQNVLKNIHLSVFEEVPDKSRASNPMSPKTLFYFQGTVFLP